MQLRKLLYLLSGLLLCSSLSYGADGNTITAVILRDLQPISYWDQKQGKPDGFAVDMTNAIAASAGMQVRYLTVNNWQEAEDALKEGRADICPILVVNEERKKQFLFTGYTETSGVTINIRSKSGHINSLSDLQGRTAGTLRASQGVPILRNNPGITPVFYDSYQMAILELVAGKIDAFIGPDNVVLKITREAGIADQIKILHPPLAEIKRAIAVNSSNPELLARLAPLTSEFVTSPTYQKLYTKWYGSPPAFWTTRRVMIAIGSVLVISITVLAIWRYRLMQLTVAERTRSAAALHEKAIELEQEIAERQKAQEALELLNATLEERIQQTIAELRTKDDLLIHQNRLAAMGELLTSIAHQWRQPLNNIAICIQTLQFLHQQQELTEEEMDQQIRTVMDLLTYMSHTIDDFRKFFREDREEYEFVLREVVERSLNLIKAALAANDIQVTVEGDETVRAMGHPNEYSHALMNILHNARDILLERQVADPRIRVAIFNEQGRSVVTVQDNGGGIPDAIMPQIFDPYFTTKGPAVGTGIGLYMARTLIERNMGGRLTARNVDGGAEFRIEL